MSFEKCSICNKILSDKRSLRRHNQTVHKQYAQNNSFVCDECGFAKTKVLEMENHMRKEHLSVDPRYCLYSNKFFVGDAAYMEHMNKIHGLPVWNADAEKDNEAGISATEQAFGGVLKTYDIPVGSHEVDLLRFIRSKQQEIDNIIQLNTQAQPQKVQFTETIELRKPVKSELSSSQDERLTIYANSKMQRVDFAGMTNECFTEKTEQMLLALNNFSSHGSGWSIHQINNIEIRLVKVKPINASSYLALPTELARSRFLLNIRNQQDERCFLYCFTAQYHNLFGPALTTSHDSWRQR